jgi:hypothetical protein
MMRIRKLLVPVILFVASSWLGSQTQLSFAYIESFRKGATHVTEQTLQVDLDPKNPTCEIKVKDQNGRDRYQFRCLPQHPGTGDNRIVAWQISLADREHKIYGNVLMPTPDPTQDRTQIGWLDPGKFAKVPLTMERVVKVDRFYCVFQVTDSHFTAPGEPYLDHLTLAVRFTNAMPHTEVRAKDEKASS